MFEIFRTVVGVNTLPGTYSTVLYKYCMFGKENISQQQQYCSLLSVILYVRVLCSDRLEYQYLLLVRVEFEIAVVQVRALFTEMQHLFYLLMKDGQAEDHHTFIKLNKYIQQVVRSTFTERLHYE